MDEYIDREAAIKAIEFSKGVGCSGRCTQGIKYIPAADVVEVVRCKDCIYSRFDLDMSEEAAPWLLCKKLRDAMFPLMVAKTDYCCWAERKEVQG